MREKENISLFSGTLPAILVIAIFLFTLSFVTLLCGNTAALPMKFIKKIFVRHFKFWVLTLNSLDLLRFNKCRRGVTGIWAQIKLVFLLFLFWRYTFYVGKITYTWNLLYSFFPHALIQIVLSQLIFFSSQSIFIHFFLFLFFQKNIAFIRKNIPVCTRNISFLFCYC